MVAIKNIYPCTSRNVPQTNPSMIHRTTNSSSLQSNNSPLHISNRGGVYTPSQKDYRNVTKEYLSLSLSLWIHQNKFREALGVPKVLEGLTKSNTILSQKGPEFWVPALQALNYIGTPGLP